MATDKEIGERLARARKAAGFPTAAAAAAALSMKYPTYAGHENGSRGMRANLEAYSRRYRVSLDWLLTGRGTGPEDRRMAAPFGQVPLKGYIGAGGEVFAEEFGGDETVEAPAEAAPETVAARVRGTSMYPTFQDGWLIYWSKQLAPDALMNTIVVAQLEDNRIMVKTIMPGSKPGLWNLVSVNPNTPPMIDQVVRWVAPIDWIRPR